MIAKARERAIYDDLAVGDLLEYMAKLGHDSVDLVIAADVFVYVGKLDRVFEHCRKILRPGGLLAFSLEACRDENENFTLHTTGRYQHSKTYIDKLGQRFNFTELYFAPIHVRKEEGEPVGGYIHILERLPT